MKKSNLFIFEKHTKTLKLIAACAKLDNGNFCLNNDMILYYDLINWFQKEINDTRNYFYDMVNNLALAFYLHLNRQLEIHYFKLKDSTGPTVTLDSPEALSRFIDSHLNLLFYYRDFEYFEQFLFPNLRDKRVNLNKKQFEKYFPKEKPYHD